MSNTNTNTDKPAFPEADFVTGRKGTKMQFSHPGMTLREYAAIHLKVPNSGNPELDKMILQSLRNDFAAKALQGLLADTAVSGQPEGFALNAYRMAAAALKASQA